MMLPDIYEIQLPFGCPSPKNAMNFVYCDILSNTILHSTKFEYMY